MSGFILNIKGSRVAIKNFCSLELIMFNNQGITLQSPPSINAKPENLIPRLSTPTRTRAASTETASGDIKAHEKVAPANIIIALANEKNFFASET